MAGKVDDYCLNCKYYKLNEVITSDPKFYLLPDGECCNKKVTSKRRYSDDVACDLFELKNRGVKR